MSDPVVSGKWKLAIKDSWFEVLRKTFIYDIFFVSKPNGARKTAEKIYPQNIK